MKSAILLIAALLVPLGSTSCTTNCTEKRATDGVDLTIAKSLYARGGSLELTICDGDDCSASIRELSLTPPRADWHRAFDWDDFDHRFSAGEVTAVVEIFDADGAAVARREEQILLSWVYPNGEHCDEQDYLRGKLALVPADDLRS